MINYSSESLYLNKNTEEAIISFKKIRDFGLKNFSLSGNITSIKKNDLVSFESSLERDYIYLLEFDNKILQYCEQPLRIYYKTKNKKSHYVPDFYVKYSDGRPSELIEIKYSEDLLKNKKKLQDKFLAAKSFCNVNNINFKTLTEKEIRTDFLFNCKFLLGYKKPRFDINFEEVEKLQYLIEDNTNSTPNSVINLLNTDLEHKAQLLYILWYMISNDLVKCDLSSKLSMNSKIWL